MSDLLERDTELEALASAVAEAHHGRGSTVLVSGEAGIGKTTLVRTFLRRRSGRTRVLAGGCDDLMTPRILGPLHDAARDASSAPRLAAALADGDRDAVHAGVLAELGAGEATVLLVEDVHWADDATLDVLRYVGRRLDDVPAVVVVTFRDDEVGGSLRRLLGGLTGPAVHRVALRPLSRAAVARWAGGTNATSAPLYRLTGGNPFYLSEVLAAEAFTAEHDVPPTVVDAVLARVRQFDPDTQAALEQLAVVPAAVELPLARALLDDMDVLAPAERGGLLEVGVRSVAFRHELARRAVEGSVARSRLIDLNARVLRALTASGAADLARVVHHAVQAGDGAAVVAAAPDAARAACAAGAQGQGAALYAQALDHPELLTLADRARLGVARAWALFHSDHRQDARAVARDAVDAAERVGDPDALGQALACLAVQQWSTLCPGDALESAERASRLLEPGGDTPARVFALLYRAVILVNLDREHDALACLDTALAMAHRTGAGHLVPLCRIYRGRARMQLGEDGGLDELLAGIDAARADRHHESVLWGYHNLVGVLWRHGRYDELPRHLDAGAEYGRDHDIPTHERGREAFRYRLMVLRGEWAAGETGLRDVLGDPDDPGVLDRHALPGLALVAVREGRDDADDLLDRARANAERAQSLPALASVTAVALEHAWLTGTTARGLDVEGLLARTERPGREHERGELLRWRRRAGERAEPFTGCPEEYAAGLRGDWRAAAEAWRERGAPYEQALELADSGDVEATREALAIVDALGAKPASATLRRRLRELGVTAVPRGPVPATRENPCGLTDRQLEILRLLAGGHTNAEIANDLVVSVRTVDHHVSAVLAKLGVTGRREAVATASRLGLD